MAKEIAKSLLDIEAVTLSPNDLYTWSSGIKSPIYCDNRVTLGYPLVRGAIRDGLINLIKEHFPEVEVISGTATAGIPHAAFIAEKLKLPMNYVRSSNKSHGKQNQIEGAKAKVKSSCDRRFNFDRGSSVTAVEALKQAGAEVLGVVAIFTYGLKKADDTFSNIQLPFYTLSDYNELIEVAENEGEISSEDIKH